MNATATIPSPVLAPNGMPWDGLTNATNGAKNVQDALAASNMNFKVVKCLLSADVPGENGVFSRETITDEVGVYRTDTKAWLGNVGPNYHLLQNHEAFSFFDNLVGEGEAEYENVGVIDKGRKIFIFAKLPEDIVVNGKDVSKCYLLLYNAHDGTSSIKVRFTPLRMTCRNMLHAILNSRKSLAEISVRHTLNAAARLEEAQKLLSVVRKERIETAKLFNRMAETAINEEQLEGFLVNLYPKTEGKGTRGENIRSEIRNLFYNGQGNNGETVWDLYNGAIEFVDHHRSVKNLKAVGNDPTEFRRTRFEAATFGTGLPFKEKAFQLATAMLN